MKEFEITVRVLLDDESPAWTWGADRWNWETFMPLAENEQVRFVQAIEMTERQMLWAEQSTGEWLTKDDPRSTYRDTFDSAFWTEVERRAAALRVMERLTRRTDDDA